MVLALAMLSIAAVGSANVPGLPATIEIVTEELPPYNYTENGKITGLATEVVETVLARLGIAGHFTSLPWSRAMRNARSEPNTLIYSIGRNDEREALFKWVGQVAPGKNFLYCVGGRDLKLNSLEDAKAYITGTVIRDYREDFLVKHGFGQGGNMDSTTGNELNYAKLKAGRIDLWLIDKAVMTYIVRAAGDDPKTAVKPVLEIADPALDAGSEMAFGLKTEDSVVDAFRKALEGVRADGTYAAIVKKWYAESR